MKQMIQKTTRISLRLLSLVAVLAFLLGSAVFISSVEASSTNLVSNPGFENLCSGIPCNWSKTYDESAFSPSTIAHTGTYSLLVTGYSARGAVSDCVSGIPANASIAIDYWFNAQSDGVTNGYGVGQFYSDSSCSTNIGNYLFSGYGASNPGSWVLSHSEYTSPTGTNSARFQIIAGCGGFSGACPATVLYDDVSVTIVNTPPSVDAGGSYSGNEGSTIALSAASASDTDGDALTYSWSINSSLCSFDSTSALNPNLTCSDNGNFIATLSVSDGVNPAVTSDASVTVNNVAPTLGAISVDADLVPVGTAITAGANFSDPGTLDTHTAAWDWGDGTSAGTVTESAGSGSVSDSHSYSAAGVYTVKLSVTDKDGAVSNQSIYQYVVVYDPSAGFVTGGGWIDSPLGAYMDDPSLSGKATFGFVSKYKKGASVPSGNTEFEFQAGDFDFYSETYDWLVVNQAGTNAQFKGSGTVNGALDSNGNPYKFQLWAGDGSPDTFRIKIWSEDSSGVETVVYDNGFDQAIGGGSIVVHSK